MNYYVLTGLVNAVTSTTLAFIVYFQGKKNSLQKSFVLFCFGVALWSWPYCFWPTAEDQASAIFWFRVLHVGAILIPFFYFRFVIIFLDQYQKYKRALKLGYLVVLILLIFDFHPLFIKEMREMTLEYSFKYWAVPGILYPFFLLMFFSYAVYCWYLLWRSYQKSTTQRREQIKYILAGTLIGFLGGSTNYFLWYNVPIPPFGNGLVAIYVVLTAYALTKHYLFGIRVILTEILVGATGLTLLIQAVVAETLLLKVLNSALLIFFSFFGYTLIKSVIKEIELRGKLQVAYKELEKLDKAKTEFLSIASHQLRTPLTAIKGYISMILEKSYGKVPEKIRKPLENVFTSNERLVKLVNDLLDISRIETGKMEVKLEKASLEDIISSVAEELKIKVKEKNLYLKWEKPEIPLPKILIDKDKIRHVILNLIDNAIKYTQHGGVTVKTQITNSKLQIAVSDSGAGLEKDEVEKIFGILTRGRAGMKLWTEGAGLGLHIARSFATMHDGKVWAESEGMGKGSTFYVELPVKK